MYSLQTSEQVLQGLSTSTRGLSSTEVIKRQEQYGFNELPSKKRSLLLLFFAQFHDVLVYILIGALSLSVVMPFFEGNQVSLTSFLDAYVILAILLLNAILGFVQEYKAEAAIAMLQKLAAPSVRVRRDGEECHIPSRELVPGDIAIIEAGDRVSADGRLLTISHLRLNESSLTGEARAVNKSLEKLSTNRSLAEQKNMVFSGTLVAVGAAEYVVTATGSQAEIGKIAKLVSETKIPDTPLQKRMRRMSAMLGIVVLGLCIIVILIGLLQRRSFFEILLIGISLAVSAVPEGLPAVVTVCFAVGVKRMVRKNAIVRKLDALETLGSVTVICSDKTGTITENHMRVVDVWLPLESKKGDRKLLAQIGASCNRAQLPDLGDPTEIGLLEFAEDLGVERLPFSEEEVPFTSEEKYMRTRHGERSFLKGAPEKIVTLCTDVDIEHVLEQNKAMSSDGLRVLACAVAEGKSMHFVGLIAMEDRPRRSVREAIYEAKQAGIRSMMITGDNIETAKAIAADVGIVGDAMEGEDIEHTSDLKMREIVRTVSVYARVSPEHKLKILHALQANGEIVAMSGDGVNDAPALKGAHVGVAMGKIGTQVAREAASVVLADDHFSTMVTAVREGRTIYDNIRKFVLFLLQANFYEILLVSVVMILDMPLPYLPIHILWINLITDGLPALALGMEKAEPDVMQKPPRPSSEGILTGHAWRLVFATLVGFIVSFTMYMFLAWRLNLEDAEQLMYARSVMLMTAICYELLLAQTVRSSRSLWRIGWFSNAWIIGATILSFALQFVILYTPLSLLLRVTPIRVADWGFAFAIAFASFVLFEVLKIIPVKSRHLSLGQAVK